MICLPSILIECVCYVHASTFMPVSVCVSLPLCDMRVYDKCCCVFFSKLKTFAFICLLCVHMWAHVCHGTYVNIRGHCVDVRSLLLPEIDLRLSGLAASTLNQ